MMSLFKPSTIGVEADGTKIITYKNKKYSINFFDTAGLERFRGIKKACFLMGDGFFIVFDLSNEQSLKSAEEWINSIKE